MTFDVGQVTIYDDTVSILDPEVITMAQAIPLAVNQAVFWNMCSAPQMGIVDMKFEMINRNLTAQAGVIGDGAATGWVNGTTTTALPMTADAVNVLTIGSVIKVEDEIVVVSAVDRSGLTIGVYERGAGSTTGVAHADTTAFAVIGHAGNDTDLANVESFAEESNSYTNYAQTVFETVDYTQRNSIIGRKAMNGGNVDLLKQEAMNRMAIKLARASLLGVKRVGTATIPYMTAGLYEQLADTAGATRPVLRYNASSAPFTEDILKAALEDVFERGNPDTILVNQSNKNIINEFNRSFINTDISNTKAGYSVMQYEYEGKVLGVVVDQDCTSDKVSVLTKSKCQKGWLSGDTLRFAEEPKTSSREHRDSLQGSVAVIVDGVGYDHIDIYGIA